MTRDVRVFPDYESLSRAAADWFASLTESAVASRGMASIALPGGSTPRRLYELLGAPPFRNSADWQRIHFFWTDERCVPPGHPESNFKPAQDLFLANVPVPAANVHRIRGEEGAERAAAAYETELQRFFGAGDLPVFDLLLLGMGADGHTASLFPGSAALTETRRLAVPVVLPSPELSRVTLTLPVLNNARSALVLVSGASKRKALREILEQGDRAGLPAGLVDPVHGSIRWWIDGEAAPGISAT